MSVTACQLFQETHPERSATLLRESARLTIKAGFDSSPILLGVSSAAAGELNRSS